VNGAPTGGRVVRERHQEVCVEITPDNGENFFDIDSADDYQKMVTRKAVTK